MLEYISEVHWKLNTNTASIASTLTVRNYCLLALTASATMYATITNYASIPPENSKSTYLSHP